LQNYKEQHTDDVRAYVARGKSQVDVSNEVETTAQQRI